ncbi:ABC transporter substrate-binding protein [Celeribacter halophilus]|jgi:ABC-type nitrate/sulfonate/bicarbonate transport system substrate-binding protein|uniref:Thiamine pyrimidine synthase n=1 Tax=Celeribacter halophilus TaxID=576117 RepID=A0AAW7XU94_9RHOB|nr:ABC transporter substrate-binding protein [Celeribacter halophilus]MDO6457585.1 ABC transporter substrate-binding protein [Celeribacter halophilus]MDO6722357.1 ABC transporter substrate-binding protein [Celeribacter halophilus]
MTSQNLSRRGFLGASAATIAYLGAGGPAAAADTTFKFITPFSLSLSFASVLFAEAKGYYNDEGLAFEVESAKGAAMASQMVIAEQMDSARTGGTNYIVSKVDHGAPLISIATIAQLSPFFVITSTENPAETISDLSGRTVGMASLGGSMEGTLDLLLLKGGVDPESVKRVKVADSAASFALIEAGRAGAFIGNTSSMIKAKSTGKGVQAFPMDDGMPGQVYVAREDDVAANPAKYVSFLKATHRAALEIATTAEADLGPILEVIGSMHDVNGLSDMETAKRDLATNAQNWLAKGEENLLRNIPDVWSNAVSMLHGQGMIGEAVDPKTLYTNALLDEALGV